MRRSAAALKREPNLAVGLTDVVFDRDLSVRDVSVRQELVFSCCGGAHPRHRDRVAPACLRRRPFHYRRPQRDRCQPVQRPRTVRTSRYPRLVARRHARRNLDSGPLHRQVRDCRSSRGCGSTGARSTATPSCRPVSRPRSRSAGRAVCASPVGSPERASRQGYMQRLGYERLIQSELLLRPVVECRRYSAPRACHAPGHRIREGPRRRHTVPLIVGGLETEAIGQGARFTLAAERCLVRPHARQIRSRLFRRC